MTKALSYQIRRERIPTIALVAKQKRRSKSKCSFKWLIISSILVVVGLQIVLLRSVDIPDQIPYNNDKGNNEVIQTTKMAPVVGQPKAQKPGQQDSNRKVNIKMLYEEPILLSDFPDWIQEYVEWHQQVRKSFPGMELFENPKAPPLLVRTCLGLCGGLHDRVGQLPWDLYLAFKTKRVLLMAWQRPKSLENFLIPSGYLNWTIPQEAHFGFNDMHRVRNITELFQGYPEDGPNDEFFSNDVDKALERANTGIFRNTRILRHRILGHLGEKALEKRIRAIGGAYQNVHESPLFGKIFWLFFKPSQAVGQKTKQIMMDLNLIPGSYTAVHCRVRHPKAFKYGTVTVGKNPKYPADKTGLPWEGDTRQAALEVATKALQCAGTSTSSKQVYFLSDSNDLVRHVTKELPGADIADLNYNWTSPELKKLVSPSETSEGLTVVARDVSEETAHLDRQKGRPATAYYDTFVDLLIVMHAGCAVYGIGYYAAFGAKLSGTPCRYLYQQEEWGSQSTKNAKVCNNIQQ